MARGAPNREPNVDDLRDERIDKVGLWRHLRDRFRLEWDGIHGGAHWARVGHHGRRMARANGASEHVVTLFACLHDAERFDEYRDAEHGARAAALAETLRGEFFDATIEEMDLLRRACEGHSHGGLLGPLTVQTCWDADRLDLGRVGIRPRAESLCTVQARAPATIEAAWARSRRWLLRPRG